MMWFLWLKTCFLFLDSNLWAVIFCDGSAHCQETSFLSEIPPATSATNPIVKLISGKCERLLRCTLGRCPSHRTVRVPGTCQPSDPRTGAVPIFLCNPEYIYWKVLVSQSRDQNSWIANSRENQVATSQSRKFCPRCRSWECSHSGMYISEQDSHTDQTRFTLTDRTPETWNDIGPELRSIFVTLHFND